MFTKIWSRSVNVNLPTARAPRRGPPLYLEPLEDRSLLTSPATFSGLPYIVSPTVQVTHTAPAAEEVIAVNPNDPKNLVAAIIDASQAVGQPPGTGIVEKYAFSFDNGATWTEKFNPLVTSDGQVWAQEFDPSLAVDKLGNVYLGSIYGFSNSVNRAANGIYVNVAHFGSKDLNFTAAQTYPIEANLAANNGTSTDQPWITVDDSNSPYSGTVYALWQEHSANTNQSTRMAFSRSTDQGKTWSAPLTISLPGNGNDFLDPQLAVGPNGEVYAVYQVSTHKFTQAQFFLAKSTDGGQTFAPAVAITPVLNDLTFPSTYGKGTYPSIAVSPIDGTVFVTYADQPTSMSSQIEFMRSTDGGVTFSAPVVINDTFTGQHFFSALTVDETGVVHASWFDGRNSPTDSSHYDVYASYSLDDGATFSPNARVTSGLLDAGGAQIIGDYTGIAAAGGFAHPVWVSGWVHAPVISGDGVLQTATLKLPANIKATATGVLVASDAASLPSTLTPGPLVLLSNPDVLADFPTNGVLSADAAVEPYVAVNPANSKNIVAGWIEHNFAGTVAGVTLDGGQTWKNVPVTGYVPGYGADPWLAFAPNGDLYFMSVTAAAGHTVNKSSDGGLTWSSPIQIDGQDNGTAVDKASITADPTKPNYVYATWVRFNKSFNGNGSETMFARTTDGGKTWEPGQSIHSTSAGEFNWGNQIVVLPDGTLIDAFTEGDFTNNHPLTLTLLRSIDQGRTWSAPISAAVQEPLLDPQQHQKAPIAQVTDPDTGHLVNAVPMFPSITVDPHSGNFYAVWLDARFGNSQYNSIALSMSSDGGFTWSDPIQVNQTPNNVPAGDRQAFNPTVAVAADGTVGVTYYDFRNNTPAPGGSTDYWMASCLPSAAAPATNPANWSEVRLTDTSFDVEQAPTRSFLGGGYALGDYDGLAAAGKDFVAVWAMPDGTPGGRENIFFRREFSTTGTATAALQPAIASLSAISLSAVVGPNNGVIGFAPLPATTLLSSPPLPSLPAASPVSPLSAPGTMLTNATSAPDTGVNVPSTLPIRPLSAFAAQKGLVTDFGVDLASDILAENMAMVLVP